jgi:hypothetical protein
MKKQEIRPWLIQRLTKPIQGTGPLAALANAFSFGGGLKNGGLSDKGMEMLKSVMSFDYMGASEFEWGALPKALQRLAGYANKNELIFNTINTKPLLTYYICNKEHKDDVVQYIKAAAKQEPRLKERINYARQLEKFDAERGAVGWIVVDEHDYGCPPFMWFIDETMFNGVKGIFGLV